MLDKASQVGMIEQIIRAAIQEAQAIEYAREPVGCSKCRIILSRYSAVKQEFGLSVPTAGIRGRPCWF
jgi:hypothetical protein